MSEQAVSKQNYHALSAEGSLFFAGLAFMDVNAVIPVFVFTYTQSLKLAGLATTLDLSARIISQLLIGPYVKSIRNLPAYITRIALLFRPLPFLMVPILFSPLANLTIVLLFLAIYGLFFLGDGLVLVPWTDLLGRTIPYHLRGQVFGNQLLYGGLGGLAAGYLVKYLLDQPSLTDAVKYSLIFSGAGLVLTLSALAMLWTHDLPHTVVPPPKNNWHYYRALPQFLKDSRDLQQISWIRITSSITTMIAPLLILFGSLTFKLSVEHVSTLVFLQILGGLLGGVIWSFVSGRLGNKQVVYLSQVIGLLIPAAAILCFGLQRFPAAWYLLWPIVLLNGINMGNWVGFLNYTIDISTEENRTVHMLISNIINFPLTILTFLAGIIADQTGFLALFLISGAAALLGMFLATRLKDMQAILMKNQEVNLPAVYPDAESSDPVR